MTGPMPPRRSSDRGSPPEVPGLRALTSLIAGVVVIGALYVGRDVLMPITLAVLLSFVLAPFATALRRVGFGHAPSVIAAVLVALLVLAATSVLIGAQIAQLAGDLPQYEVAVERKAKLLHEETIGRADALLKRASGAFRHIAPPPEPPSNDDRSASRSGRPPMSVEVIEPRPSSLKLVQRFVAPVVSPLETAGIVAVIAIFILLQREDLRDRLIRLFGVRDLHRTTTAMNEAALRLSRYFLAQVAINASVGTLICIGLAIIGVPGALLFGVLTALLRFVPYIGAWLAALLAVILAAAIGPGWWMTVWTAILFAVIELTASQFVEPLLYGNSTGLSPFGVIIAAIFWSWIWGPVGLVLSTPLTLCLVTLGRHIERVAFLDVLFGDHPVLTPGENLYQRLLADDAPDALAQAATMLEKSSPEAWYDTVMLECLRLACGDVARGVITPGQLTAVRLAALGVVRGLASIDSPGLSVEPRRPGRTRGGMRRGPSHDGQHEALDEPATVLCVKGRGEFDGVAATILVQLLRRRGIEATALSAERFLRRRVDEARIGHDTVICLVTLDWRESPPYLRNLVRGLRARSPHLIMGIAFAGDADAAQRQSAPDQPAAASPVKETTIGSFTELTDACIEALHARSQPDGNSDAQAKGNQLAAGAL
ncbi:AI-2E family transporter [Paraburkholderia sp. NMBU_R16]|uniref:AI-2E family transporter n=1 Tax=Paraburkholderia sp. NMBU_R16 TaxID=2698676 RepID=UPI0015648A0C|nr:AI-2E family transporter [Paraburkholderia sp. NMBU_R16]NRO96061.1 AI-2E family transporter [Paraburkholderia sp. NMBU_R16]